MSVRAPLNLRDDGGSAAVEFAVVSAILMTTILFVLCVGVILVMDQDLDAATDAAARQIMIGNAQKTGLSIDSLRSTYICPKLRIKLSCENIVINVQTLQKGAKPSGFYRFVTADNKGLTVPNLTMANGKYDLGTQGSYVYVQVVYPVTFLPKIIANLIARDVTYNGKAAYLITSTAAFANEQY